MIILRSSVNWAAGLVCAEGWGEVLYYSGNNCCCCSFSAGLYLLSVILRYYGLVSVYHPV